MSDLDRATVLDALDAVYEQVTTVVSALGEADLAPPSRTLGTTPRPPSREPTGYPSPTPTARPWAR